MVLFLLLACSGGEPAVSPPAAAQKTTFTTLRDLGSFRLGSSLERSVRYGESAPEVTLTASELAWQDPDHFAYTRLRDQRVESRLVVYDGVGWLSTGTGPWSRRGDPEPLRAQVARGWDPWTEAVGGFEDDFVFTDVGRDEVDGRRARRFELSLAPPPATAGKAPRRRSGWVTTAVGGEVWVDEATALRLQARVQVEAEMRGQAQSITLLMSVTSVGGDVGVTPPEGP